MDLDLGARCLGRGVLRGIERDTVPQRVDHRPGVQNRGELVRVLDGPVLGAKPENGAGLFGADAWELEELRGVGEVDSHLVPHGRLLQPRTPDQMTIRWSVLRETP